MKEIEFWEIEPEYETEERAFESSDGHYVISKRENDWFLQEKTPTKGYGNIARGKNLQELKAKTENFEDIVIRLDLGELKK